MIRQLSNIGTAKFSCVALIIVGWAMCTLILGFALLAAVGVVEPSANAHPWWHYLLKGFAWPAGCHALADWIGRQREQERT
jgi:hypothetical protein